MFDMIPRKLWGDENIKYFYWIFCCKQSSFWEWSNQRIFKCCPYRSSVLQASVVECCRIPTINLWSILNAYSINTSVDTLSTLNWPLSWLLLQANQMSWPTIKLDCWFSVSWVSVKMLIKCQSNIDGDVGWVSIKISTECQLRIWTDAWQWMHLVHMMHPN